MTATILVPLDGSSLAARALPYATTLARAAGSRLILVRAAQARILPRDDRGAAEQQAVERVQQELAAAAGRLGADGFDVDPHVYYDAPAAAIVDAARRRHADLIVMSTHGRTGLGRWIYGSVADQVLRAVDRPVVLVPAACGGAWPEPNADRPRRILIPLDGSAFAEEVIGPATELADALGAGLLLFRAVTPMNTAYLEAYPYLPADPESELEDARRYVSELAADLRAAGRSVDERVELGFPVQAVIDVARDEEVLAIALATHGRGGVGRLVMGSVATGVLQRSHVPLLLARPATLVQARVAPIAPVTTEPAPNAPITVTLDPDERRLVELALEELLLGTTREEHLTGPLQALIAKLRHAGMPVAGAAT